MRDCALKRCDLKTSGVNRCENMRLLLSSLFIASLHARFILSVSSGPLVVSQSPDVSVTEGETLNIICCWTGLPGRKLANWLRNQTSIKTEVFTLKNGSQGKETTGCSQLTFTSITREDSGRYTCRVAVETPNLIEVDGKGTVITVRCGVNSKDDTDTLKAGGSHNEEVLVYVLRCLPVIALVTTFVYLSKIAAKARHRTPAAPGNKPTSA